MLPWQPVPFQSAPKSFELMLYMKCDHNCPTGFTDTLLWERERKKAGGRWTDHHHTNTSIEPLVQVS